MKKILHFVHIHAPVAEVYRALTTAEGLAGWWSTRVTVEPGVGGLVAAVAARPVPKPEDLTGADPAVTARIEETWRATVEAPQDASRWLELARVYQAHQLTGVALDCYQEATRLAPGPRPTATRPRTTPSSTSAWAKRTRSKNWKRAGLAARASASADATPAARSSCAGAGARLASPIADPAGEEPLLLGFADRRRGRQPDRLALVLGGGDERGAGRAVGRPHQDVVLVAFAQ